MFSSPWCLAQWLALHVLPVSAWVQAHSLSFGVDQGASGCSSVMSWTRPLP